MAKIKLIEGISGKVIDGQYQYRALCLGIDQAYGDTGIAIAGITLDKQIDIIATRAVPPVESKSKVEYRAKVNTAIRTMLKNYRALGDEFCAICESVRVYTEGNISIRNHLNWGALQGSMHDCLYNTFGASLRIVDTRAWKSAVVGTSKPSDSAPTGVDPKKWPTIQCMMHEYDVPKEWLTKPLSPRTKKYTWQDEKGNNFTYNSDVADACAIAIYGLIRPVNKLKLAP